jgi:hypothetical protein
VVGVKIVVTAVFPVLLLALAAHRIRSDATGQRRHGTATGLANPLTQLLLRLGLAKACRIRHVTDDVINPVLQHWTGVANIMSLAGMTFGGLAAIPVFALSSYITGRNPRHGAQLVAAIVIVVAMIATFLHTPMAHIPTSYMSNQFAVTTPVLTYWIVYLIPIAFTSLISGVYVGRELWWVHRGPFAGALTGVAVAAFLGLAYCAFKIVNLVLKDTHSGNWWYRYSEPISIGLGLVAIAAAGTSAGIYAWFILKDRLHRHQLLRQFGDRWVEARTTNPDVVLDPTYTFRPTRRMCWSASQSPAAAYRLQIELADHAHYVAGRSALTSQAIS